MKFVVLKKDFYCGLLPGKPLLEGVTLPKGKRFKIWSNMFCEGNYFSTCGNYFFAYVDGYGREGVKIPISFLTKNSRKHLKEL